MWIAIAIIVAVAAFLIVVTIYQYVRPPRGKVIGHKEFGAVESEAIIEQSAKANQTQTWI